MNRKEAMKAGVKRYFTGKPCVRGHISERLVSTRVCLDCANQRMSAWRKGNRRRVNEWHGNWQKRNRDKMNAMQRRRLSNPLARAKHYQNVEKWRINNLGKRAATEAKHRATAIERTPAWADLESIRLIYEEASTMRMKGMDVEVDHVIPLRGRLVSGLHVQDNLRIITGLANRTKSNSFQGVQL